MHPVSTLRRMFAGLALAAALGACGATGEGGLADAGRPDAGPDARTTTDADRPDAGPDARPAADPEPGDVLPLTVREGRFFDARGREVLLRGLNARVRGIFDVSFDDGRLPLIPVEPFTSADCRFIAAHLGMNLLRLPINWSALEPVRGAYDDTYLARVRAVVDDCASAGVYTLVDLHQDAYSKEIGQDGAPLWAIVPAPERLLGGPLTDLEIRRLSAPVIAAFASLYDNRDGLSDAHAAMAAHAAAFLEGAPGLVGLELHNEPVSFQAPRLADFHERSGRAVRAAAPALTIVFEPDALRNLRDSAPVTHPFPLDNAVYAPHIYTGVFSRGRDNWADGEIAPLQASTRAARTEADAHGAALLIGEFGIDPRAPNASAWLENEFALFDETFAGAAFWVYEEYGEGGWGLYDNAGTAEAPMRGALREGLAVSLSHPYPQAVDGRLISTRFDPAAATLTVTLADAGPGEHWLAAPERRWPGGVVVTCDGAPAPMRAGPGRVAVRCSGRTLVVQGVTH